MEELVILETSEGLLSRDIVKYIILPYVFEVCCKCGRYMSYEAEFLLDLEFRTESERKTCNRCSICADLDCTRRGTADDFHYKNYGYPALHKWLCSKHFL